MAAPFIESAFTSGEISPALYGNVALAKVHSAATTMRNMFVSYKGGAYSRAGTKFVGMSRQSPLSGQLPPRVISFEFSVTQGYVLEFGDQYVRFIFHGGQVVEAPKAITGATQANPCQITSVAHGFNNDDWVVIEDVTGMTELNEKTFIVENATANTFTLDNLDFGPISSVGFGAYTGGGTAKRIYTIASPYAASDLDLLKFAQSADVVTLTHPNYPVYNLSRLGATNWTLTPESFGANIQPPSTVSATATVHPSGSTTPPTLPTAYAYEVTAIDPQTGQESVASPIANLTDSVDIAATAGSIIIT